MITWKAYAMQTWPLYLSGFQKSINISEIYHHMGNLKMLMLIITWQKTAMMEAKALSNMLHSSSNWGNI